MKWRNTKGGYLTDHKFWYIISLFHLSQITYFPRRCVGLIGYLIVCGLISTYLCISQISFCYWWRISFHCRTHLAIISIFWMDWGLPYALVYGLSWRMVHVHLRRMYILLLLGRAFYRRPLGLVASCCSSSLLLPS